MKKLGALEGRIHCLDLLAMVKTGLKLFNMVGGRVAKMQIDDIPQVSTSPGVLFSSPVLVQILGEADINFSHMDISLKIGILRQVMIDIHWLKKLFRMFSHMDPDNSGCVDKAEFEAYIRQQRLALGKAKITKLYCDIQVHIVPLYCHPYPSTIWNSVPRTAPA